MGLHKYHFHPNPNDYCRLSYKRNNYFEVLDLLSSDIISEHDDEDGAIISKHGDELEFTFGAPLRMPGMYYSKEVSFAFDLNIYWTNFVKTG